MIQKDMFAKSQAFDMSRFTVDEKSKETYEHWVHETSKLIKRPYFQTHKMVEKWPIDKIIRRYEEVTKHNSSEIPSDVLWWWKRKEETKKRLVHDGIDL